MKNGWILIILFVVNISCNKSDKSDPVTANVSVSALNCSLSSAFPIVEVGASYTGVLKIPYAGGNGVSYNSGSAISSTGVNGLIASLQGATLNAGSGELNFTLSGTPSAEGTATFLISFGGLSCATNISVSEAPLTPYGIPFGGVPDPRDAVIYQVNMRAFSATRNFRGVIDRLDSIKALGVNVIYLMPTYSIGVLKAINSPYCIKDYKAVNSEFGTLNDLRSLTDGAHNRGMAVIMDWVANHTSWDHAWIEGHKDWYDQDAGGTIKSPPLGWTDVAQLNFNNMAMRKEMIRSMKYWVYTANIDGFRCDYADGPPNDFWAQAIDTLRNSTGHTLLMFAESNNTSKYAAGFDYIFGFNFYGTLKSVFSTTAQSVKTLDNLNNTDFNGVLNPKQQVVRYLTNHDVNSSDGTALKLFGGSSGSMSAFVVVAYMKSVPMIYNGQEVGTTFPLNFLSLGTPINWNQNQSMVDEYKSIIAFRNNSQAIRKGILTMYSTADICAFTKELGGEKVFVACNLRNTTNNYVLPASVANSTWTNALTGAPVSMQSELTLPAYHYQVLKK